MRNNSYTNFFAVLMVLFVLSAMPAYAAPVDGFIGVPWGASRQEVQKVMQERGFTLLEQRADGIVDTYRGTFTGQPAELRFQYQNNVYFAGTAAFLHVKGSFDGSMAYYYELKEQLTAKYGTPLTYNIASGSERSSRWEGLTTMATPPGRVFIHLRYGPVSYGTGYAGQGSFEANGVAVQYSIGSAWASQKAVKDHKDL